LLFDLLQSTKFDFWRSLRRRRQVAGVYPPHPIPWISGFLGSGDHIASVYC